MLSIDLKNEKGNVKAEVRNAIRNQTIDYILNKTDFINGPNGMYMHIANTLDGEPIYATLELSISLINPEIKRDKKQVPTNIGSIF